MSASLPESAGVSGPTYSRWRAAADKSSAATSDHGDVANRQHTAHDSRGDEGQRSSTLDTWDRICKLYGWPQMFVGSR
jgi:hypothetical protein